MSDDLKSCPFCGSAPKMVEWTASPVEIKCEACGIAMDGLPGEVVSSWNRRAAAATPSPAGTDTQADADKMLAMRADYDRQQGQARGLMGAPASTGRDDFEGIAFRFFKNLVYAERIKVLQVLLGWDDKTMSQVRTHSDERRCLKRALRPKSEIAQPAPATGGELDADTEMRLMLDADHQQDGAIHEMPEADHWKALAGWMVARRAAKSAGGELDVEAEHLLVELSRWGGAGGMVKANDFVTRAAAIVSNRSAAQGSAPAPEPRNG